jgi:two-component system chemotaxis sensor kinase CheA
MTGRLAGAAVARLSSLEAKLTGVIVALTLAISGTLAVYLPAHHVESLRRELDRKALTLSRLTAHEVESAIAFGDRETAREVFESILLDPDVAGLALLTADGRLFYSAGRLAKLDRRRGPPEPGAPLLQVGRGVVRAEAVVTSKEGPGGLLVVDLSLASLETERATLVRRAALVGIATLLVGSFLAWLIARSVARRVKRLAAATSRVAAGDLRHPLVVDSSRDELGQLSRGFQHMVASITALVDQIADQGRRENERLEVMVEARTAELDARNAAMRLVLEHGGQGFVTVDGEGVMSPERSRILDRWLYAPESGTTFGEFLSSVDPRAGFAFSEGWRQAKEDVLPLELVVDQLPSSLRAGERHFLLRYNVISADPAALSLLVVVSDVTAEVEQRRAEDGQRDLAALFSKVVSDRAGLALFFTEAGALLAKLRGAVPATPVERRRALHTLKGSAKVMGLDAIGRYCHEIEDRLADTDGVIAAEDLEGLLLAWRPLAGACFSLLGDGAGRIELDPIEHETLLRDARTLPRAAWIRRLEELRNEPAARRLDRAAEHARLLAEQLGKPGLHVVLAPNGVRLDPEVWGAFWSAFVHVVRNAVDHGLESPSERVAAGKQPAGTLTLSTYIEDDELTIEVTDDGRGIDWPRVAARASREGYPHATAGDLEEALFRDGVSTREIASDVSGRGVGLGAIREACEALGGTVSVISHPGRGTCFRFRFTSSGGCQTGTPVPPVSMSLPHRRAIRTTAGSTGRA